MKNENVDEQARGPDRNCEQPGSREQNGDVRPRSAKLTAVRRPSIGELKIDNQRAAKGARRRVPA